MIREKAETVDLEDIYRPLHFHGEPFFGLTRTSNAIDLYGLDMDPDYQRGHVWTDRQRQLFVGHVLEGGPVLPVIVNIGPDGSWARAEVIDGKQRITACLMWERGEIAAELRDGRLVMASDLARRWAKKVSMSILDRPDSAGLGLAGHRLVPRSRPLLVSTLRV